jgi:hypothetical protein
VIMIELNSNGLTLPQLTSEVKDRLPTIRHCCNVSQNGTAFWLSACSLPKMLRHDPIQAVIPARLSEAQIKEALGVYAK